MDNSFKKVLKIESPSEIESIIEAWAKQFGFKHDNDSNFPKMDDMAYTFSFEDNGSKTLVFINILDDKAYIETMAVKSSFKSELSKTAIEDLLKKL